MEEISTGKQCVICMTALSNNAVFPCGHVCYCSHCVYKIDERNIQKCPLCREGVECIKKIIL